MQRTRFTRSGGADLVVIIALGSILAGCQANDKEISTASTVPELRLDDEGIASGALPALRLAAPLSVSLTLAEADPAHQRHALRQLLEDLGEMVGGEDTTDGTSYFYSVDAQYRSIEISATRAAWNDHSWTAEVRVISSDLWQETSGEVILLGLFLYGDGGSLYDAEDATARIRSRLETAVAQLVSMSLINDNVAVSGAAQRFLGKPVRKLIM